MFFQHHLPKSWFFILQPTITPLSLPSSHRGLSLFAGSLILFNHWSIVCWSVPQPWSLSWFVEEKIPSTCSTSSCVSCHFRNSLSDATIYLIGVQMGIFYNDCVSRNFANPVFDPLNYFSSVNYFVLIIIPSVKFLSFHYLCLSTTDLSLDSTLLFDHQALCMLLVDWLRWYLQFWIP